MNISMGQVRMALAMLGALVLALLLNHFIMTDKKRIERTVQQMADAAAKGDIDRLFSHVSANYRDDAMNRKQLRTLCQSLLDRYQVANANVQVTTVNVSGALAQAQVSISLASGQDTPWYGTSEWSGEFHKEADGAWRLTRVAPMKLYGRDVGSWREVLRDLR